MKTFQLKFMKNRSLVRWLQLLDEFEKNPTCTLNDLAKITKSSTRTVISDIASIRNYFSDSIEIHAAKVGYFFEELDHESYRRKKQAMVKDEPIFLIFESIFFNEVQSLMDWSLSLNLSEQSLLSYLKKNRNLLTSF
nr:HTH domain-containing protein [Enterococcus innesii]